eukprot:1309807-Rhodomonas_salina.1
MALAAGAAPADLAGLNQLDQVQLINIEGVGQCIPAVDFVCMACNKTRQEAQICIRDVLKSKDAANVAEILCRKADVPGFWEPTFVVNYKECIDLLAFLPRRRVLGIIDHINKQFQRLRAGD